MTGRLLRRALVVLGLAATLVLAVPVAASAAFSGRVSAPATVGTVTVQPPTGLSSAGSTACVTNTTSYTVRAAWTLSTSARVVGYRVIETVNGTVRAPVTVAATATSFSRTASRARGVTTTHVVTVATVTDYAWSSAPASVTYTC